MYYYTGRVKPQNENKMNIEGTQLKKLHCSYRETDMTFLLRLIECKH